MPLPAFARRRLETSRSERGPELSEAVRQLLPMRFEAVGEALVSGGDVGAVCSVVGRDVARDGAGLGEALSALRDTYRLTAGGEPAFEATESLAVAWSEATLEYLHDLSCEDPMTGLTSLAHVRTRLAELFRDAELTDVSVRERYALVVVEMVLRGEDARAHHHFTRALRLVQVAESLRAVYSGGQTIGRVGLNRAVAVVDRDEDLGQSVALVRDFLGDLDLGTSQVRVWIEGLPATLESLTRLLDELAR